MKEKKLIDAVIDLAEIDDNFRRLLQDKLEFLGQGKRGRVGVLGEREHLLVAYRAALRLLEQSGAKSTTAAAARMLASGPFSGTDPTALERRIRRYLSKK